MSQSQLHRTGLSVFRCVRLVVHALCMSFTGRNSVCSAVVEPYVAVVNLAPLSRCGSAPSVMSPSAVALPAVQGGVACCVRIVCIARTCTHTHITKTHASTVRMRIVLIAVCRWCLVNGDFKRTVCSCCRENLVLCA